MFSLKIVAGCSSKILRSLALAGMIIGLTTRVLWSQTFPLCTASWYVDGKYDTGDHPTVSLLSSGFFIEEHEWGPGTNNLLYKPGRFVNGKPNFGTAVIYDTGIHPSVAINKSGVVVDVHQDSALPGTLYYRLGHIDTNGDINSTRIAWDTGNKGVKIGGGVDPSVAINDNGFVVLAWRTNNIFYNTDLYARYGVVSRTGSGGYTLSWKTEGGYDKGWNPHVAIDNANNVIEVHKGGDAADLHYRVGKVSTESSYLGFYVAAWNSRFVTSSSEVPAVALSPTGGNVVETNGYLPGNGAHDLRYMIGRLDPTGGSYAGWSAPDALKPNGWESSVTTNGVYALAVNRVGYNTTGIQPMEDSYATLSCPAN
jgi:hypothetical protein